jgi:hypothetical protein
MTLRNVVGRGCRRRVLASILIAHTLTACAVIADKSMSAADIEECRVLTGAVLEAHQLPPAATAWGSDGRALYCGIHQRNPFIPYLYTRITVYEVVGRSEQDEVLATLRQARRRGYKPVIVRFREKEIWNVDVRRGGVSEGRGDEVELRTEILR